VTGSAGSVIPALLLLAAAGLWWHGSIRALDAARAAARAFCRRQGWQLLDQTVSIASIAPRRSGGGWVLMRRYRFDFCPDGESRRPGGVLLHGGRPLRIWSDGPDGRVVEELAARPGR
jgi:hypothetical protein